MDFIVLDDVRDSVLQVDETDIADANQFLLDTALKMGITSDKIQLPANYLVKRLGVVRACYNRCLNSVGSDGTVVFEGMRNADVFAQKLELYKTEMQDILNELRVYDFTGINATGNANIGLWRA